MDKVVIITGPTATGKTKLAVRLAKQYNGEIVSADSMQVYRGMDIGTAKVTDAEKEGVPHHMIDVAEPEETYSAARYVDEASAVIADILARKKLPVIAGGTNLYIDSLVSGRDFAENSSDGALRSELGGMYDELGGEKMLELLADFDPERAAKLHPSDKRRIVRAIEVYKLTGKTISRHDEETKLIPPRYDAAKIVLDFKDRQVLYDRIDSRVDDMLNAGLIDEVRSLLDAGISADSTAMQAIGYKEPAAYLRGEISYDEAVEQIKRESRRYAKRQLTWLRRDDDCLRILWDEKPDFNEALRLSTDFLRSRGL